MMMASAVRSLYLSSFKAGSYTPKLISYRRIGFDFGLSSQDFSHLPSEDRHYLRHVMHREAGFERSLGSFLSHPKSLYHGEGFNG